MTANKSISILNYIKEEKGLNFQQIAYATGIDVEEIEMFFNSKIDKSLDHFFKISKVLKVDVIIKCKDLNI